MAKLFNVTLRTLRFYEEKNILNPARKGTRRLYGQKDFSRMAIVGTCKIIAFSVMNIKKIIETVESNIPKDEKIKILENKCREQRNTLIEQRKLLENQIKEADFMLENIENYFLVEKLL